MAKSNAIKEGTITLTGGRAFFVPAGQIQGEKIMAIKITDRIVSVTRRGFLGSTAGVIAASGAAILPLGEVQARMPELEQMAQALHDAVGRYSDEGGPSHVEVCAEDRSITLEIEILRPCSVHEIQDLLMPLYQGGAS